MADQTTEVRLEELEKLVATVVDENKALKQQLADRDAPAKPEVAKKTEKIDLPTETFTVNKQKYKFKVPAFRLQEGAVWKKYTAKEALNQSEILKKLVEGKRFGLIELVK